MEKSKHIFLAIFFIIIFSFFYTVKEILTPFIISLIIAYCINPMVNKLENYGVKRSITVTFIVGIFFAILILILLKIIPLLLLQIKDFILYIPKYQSLFEKTILHKLSFFNDNIDLNINEKIHNYLSQINGKFFDYSVKIISGLFESSIALINLIGLIFFTPILVFYSLRDWPEFINLLYKLIPNQFHNATFKQLSKFDKVLSSYIRGQITTCLILSVFYIISLTILGLNNSLLIGIISGFLVIIPYLGLLISIAIGASGSLLQFSDIIYTYIAIAIFIAGHILEGYIISPKLIGEKIGLHPILAIFAIMSGGLIFGFWGTFFAIPVAAILVSIFRSLLAIYLSSNVYKNK
jgi:predicted PurR-regulated permease PerM